MVDKKSATAAPIMLTDDASLGLELDRLDTERLGRQDFRSDRLMSRVAALTAMTRLRDSLVADHKANFEMFKAALRMARPFVDAAHDSALFSANAVVAERIKLKLEMIDAVCGGPIREELTDMATVEGLEKL